MKSTINQHLKHTAIALSKKLTIIAIIALTLVTTAFAGDKTSPDFKGVENFRKAFPQATLVNFEVKGKYTVVNFTWNGLKLQSFYDRQGNSIGTSRTIAVNDMPLAFMVNIKNEFPGFVATEAIEFDHTVDGLNYYVTVQSPERTYVLQISSDGTISVFKKMKN